MPAYRRHLTLNLPPRQSAFLWGARKTGKSTLVREQFPDSLIFDLLDTDLFFELSKEPSRLRQKLAAADPASLRRPIVIDEVQKVPSLLDEIHGLIENKKLSFLLCGSSARKLKRGHANLLGGRAWRYELFPLVSVEVGSMDLLRALNQGLIPLHYLQEGPDAERSLKAYIQDYLKEEVFAEGLARNVPAFSRFLDASAYSHGELVNYSNIARDCGVGSKTVREYYQILSDTLLGTLVEPYKKRQERQVIGRAPKSYFFDVGVAGMLTRRRILEEKGESFGRAFEHLVFMELTAYRSYSGKDFPIRFWRTKAGQEVDFILGEGEVAIEVKGTSRVDARDLSGLRAFMDDNRPKRSILVCNEKSPRMAHGIRLEPWQRFFSALWAGDVL